jgi:hypothetical protein
MSCTVRVMRCLAGPELVPKPVLKKFGGGHPDTEKKQARQGIPEKAAALKKCIYIVGNEYVK